MASIGLAFNSHNPNLNWAVNRLNRTTNLMLLALNLGLAAIDTLTSRFDTYLGQGYSEAQTQQIENYVQWAIDKLESGVSYWEGGNCPNTHNPDATSYNCSAFVLSALYYAGINVDATYTGDMLSGLLAAGFTAIQVWDESLGIGVVSQNALLRGDILLMQPYYLADGTFVEGHTEIYIGNNQMAGCRNVNSCSVTTLSIDNFGKHWDYIIRMTALGEDD